eukprot:g471.t1
MIEILPFQRVSSFTGNFEDNESGYLHFHFDNTYSYFKNKTVDFVWSYSKICDFEKEDIENSSLSSNTNNDDIKTAIRGGLFGLLRHWRSSRIEDIAENKKRVHISTKNSFKLPFHHEQVLNFQLITHNGLDIGFSVYFTKAIICNNRSIAPHPVEVNGKDEAYTCLQTEISTLQNKLLEFEQSEKENRKIIQSLEDKVATLQFVKQTKEEMMDAVSEKDVSEVTDDKCYVEDIAVPDFLSDLLSEDSDFDSPRLSQRKEQEEIFDDVEIVKKNHCSIPNGIYFGSFDKVSDLIRLENASEMLNYIRSLKYTEGEKVLVQVVIANDDKTIGVELALIARSAAKSVGLACEIVISSRLEDVFEVRNMIKDCGWTNVWCSNFENLHQFHAWFEMNNLTSQQYFVYCEKDAVMI